MSPRPFGSKRPSTYVMPEIEQPNSAKQLRDSQRADSAESYQLSGKQMPQRLPNNRTKNSRNGIRVTNNTIK